jgi:hypothetical protein
MYWYSTIATATWKIKVDDFQDFEFFKKELVCGFNTTDQTQADNIAKWRRNYGSTTKQSTTVESDTTIRPPSDHRHYLTISKYWSLHRISSIRPKFSGHAKIIF